MQNPLAVLPPRSTTRLTRFAPAGLVAGLVAVLTLSAIFGAPNHEAAAGALNLLAPNLTPTATFTPTATPTYVSQGLAGGAGDQQAPKYDGNIVVWEDNGSGTWDIQARDLSNGSVFPVYAGSGDQQNVAISDTLVVWQDN